MLWQLPSLKQAGRFGSVAADFQAVSVIIPAYCSAD